MATVYQRIKERITEQPGLIEAEFVQAIFGMDGYQQRVNSTCRNIIEKGEIERRGNGGQFDPYTYHFPGEE